MEHPFSSAYDPNDPPIDSDGKIIPIEDIIRMENYYQKRREAHKRYRQTEKYKEKRRVYNKERRKRVAALLAQAKEVMDQRGMPKYTPRELSERQKEEKRRYNLDRYYRMKLRQESIRRQLIQEKINSGEWSNLPHLITKDSPPESYPNNGARLATEEEAAEFHKIRAKSSVERLPEDEQEIILAEHEAWYAVRGEFERIVVAARREARPVSSDEISSFRFQPVHHPMDRFPDRCGYCGCTFKTPVGNRNVSQRPEWDDSPYNCTVIMDIPDDVFWPGKK